MKKCVYAAACGIALFALIGNVVRADELAQAQDRRAPNGTPTQTTGKQAPAQFTERDRQTTKDWYNQNQNHPPIGLRPQDRLSADQESRLQPGKRLDADLQKQVHTVPPDLSHRLPAPPRNNRYVAVGGHVGLVETNTQVLRDVIHLHE